MDRLFLAGLNRSVDGVHNEYRREQIAAALGLRLEISFIDPETGEKV